MPIVAAAAAAAGVGLGWWASRKKGSDPATQRQLDLGQRMLQMEDSTVQNIEDYENLQYEMDLLDTTAKNQKREVAELQSQVDSYKRAINNIHQIATYYHRIPHPTNPAYEIIIPKESLMKQLTTLKYTNSIRAYRKLRGGARKPFTSMDHEALQFIRKNRERSLSFLEPYFDSALHSQIPDQIEQANEFINNATQGRSFEVDGRHFAGMQEMGKRLETVRRRHQQQKAEITEHEAKIKQLHAEKDRLKIDLGKSCHTLFRKWLKAPGDSSNGVPIAVVKKSRR